MTGHPLSVTFDVNVFVSAVVEGNNAFSAWPSPPPVGSFPAAECIGIVNDAREFALCLSAHVLQNVVRVLTDLDGYRWTEGRAEAYVAALVDISRSSGGHITDPAISVADCPDYEDNRILELALASGSALIVSSDAHLLDMSPCRGIPIITPAEFVGRVDGMRRARRRSS